MGQKVNPIGFRLGINRTWESRWYAQKNYAELLHKDLQIREFLMKRLYQAGVTRVLIERPAKLARITIHTARPGVVIGKKGADIERLRQDVAKMTGSEVHLNIVEIRAFLLELHPRIGVCVPTLDDLIGVRASRVSGENPRRKHRAKNQRQYR